MDRVYRRQRHIYNFTRRYYLIGRDDLVRRLTLRPGDRAVEIGCGTARNLITMARRYPGAQLFGIDASQEMLRTAEHAVARAGLSAQIRLAHGYAEALTPGLFGLTSSFDCAIFSYSLSMIPDWRRALAAASATGGRVHVLDFGDFTGFGRLGASLLRLWLRQFHVAPRTDLLHALEQAPAPPETQLRIYAGRYAFCWSGKRVPDSLLADVAVPPQAAEIS
jgi:S-adenosylmethionine-diacylgycerolhomoserine-N-methlytransferase